MKTFDRALAILLALGGVGHTLGSFAAYKHDPMTLLWSLTASEFIFLLAAVNYVRAGRPRDKALAWICLIGCVCWMIGAGRFGALIGNVFDVRVLIFVVLTLGLCVMSVRTIMVPRYTHSNG
jgi:hypothetical protein